MDAGLFAELATQWKTIWKALGDAGALANALQIVGFVIPIVTGLRWYIHRRLRDKDGQILDLQDTLADRNKKLDDARVAKGEAERLVTALEMQLPRTALARAEKERAEGNHALANRALREWVEGEGDAIAQLLMQRATWATAHSVGVTRDMGLVVAEAYAIAATVFDPEMNLGAALVDDIATFRTEEGQDVPPLRQALQDFDEHRDQLFDIDRVSEANAAHIEATRLYERGHYHLALPIFERALLLRLQTAGARALTTLRTQTWKAFVLIALGRSNEALSIALAATEALAANPAFGPEHPETLNSRIVVAEALHRLSRDDEALEIARVVGDAMEGSPAFGPTHLGTLRARSVVAQILNTLGRPKDALPIARLVADAMESKPTVGPTHQGTLISRALVAEILDSLWRPEEALPIARDVAAAMEVSPSLGRKHPSTLASQGLVARILTSMGRHEEALPLAGAVAAAMESSPALGRAHPYTLRSHALVARVLTRLQRYDEALPIARAVAASMETTPDLGPTHSSTLRMHEFIAEILAALERRDKSAGSTPSLTGPSDAIPSPPRNLHIL